MASVNLLKNVRIEGKWKLLPVVKKNGKYRWGWVVNQGREENHPQGAYHLEYRLDGKRERPTVLKVLNEQRQKNDAPLLSRDVRLSAADIELAIKLKSGWLDALKQGHATPEAKDEPGSAAHHAVPAKGKLIKDSTEDWFKGLSASKGDRSVQAYEQIVGVFTDWCHTEKIKYVSEIDADVLKRYYRWLAHDCPNKQSPTGRGVSATTRNNRLTVVGAWLKSEKITGLIREVDKARREDVDREPFTEEELKALFEASDKDEYELFMFALQTGMRVTEVSVAEWTDIDPGEGVIKVRRKPWYKFVPKHGLQREIPVPDSLLGMLRARRERVPQAALMFPLTQRVARFQFDKIVKAVGDKTAFKCGHCPGCKSNRGCARFFMHRFRHTFGCTHVRDYDLVTVRDWMGHRSVSTTELYLKAARGEKVRAKINSGGMAKFLQQLPTI